MNNTDGADMFSWIHEQKKREKERREMWDEKNGRIIRYRLLTDAKKREKEKKKNVITLFLPTVFTHCTALKDNNKNNSTSLFFKHRYPS